MKNNQNGFVIPLLTVLVVLVIGGGYLYFKDKSCFDCEIFVPVKDKTLKLGTSTRDIVSSSTVEIKKPEDRTTPIVVKPVVKDIPVDSKGATPAGIAEVVKANNDFALNLYTEYKDSGENLFFSPYSISTAVGMVYEGAVGKTAKEIQSVFKFPTNSAVRGPAFASIYNNLNTSNSKYQLSTANALWAQNDYKFLDTYLTTVQKYYGGKAINVDFKNSTEAARQTINKWVESKTNNKIKDLFEKGVLNESTKLVLTNAIYFKGTWINPFVKGGTTDKDFNVTSSEIVKVPMMEGTEKEQKFKYTEDDTVQVLEMQYQGDKISMLILLPKNNDIASFEKILTSEKIDILRNSLSLQNKPVDVFIPKFSFDTKYSMKDVLSKMGMPTVFTDGADFSLMDGSKSLSIGAVIHQAFVDVNEEGTEAAAATGINMMVKSAMPQKPIIFNVNHPFIFLIQDKQSGNIVFLGKVINPILK